MKGTKKSKSPASKSPNQKQITPKQKKEPSLQQIVKKHPHFQLLENGKIRCTLTGHEMQPKKANFEQYCKAKSYKRALQSQFDISEYEEFLVDHKEHPKNFYFCKLTNKKVAKKKSTIQKHLAGKNFQRRLLEWQQMQGEQQGEDIIEQQNEEEEQQEEQEAEK